MSDRDIGGFSSVSLDYVSSTASNPAHARFHGTISTELPANRPEVQRSGYAGFRNRDRRPTIIGKSIWNTEPYAYLALRVKSDGRRYFVNVQTESIVPTDLHQHRLYARRPGEWETVVIRWDEFVRTNHGHVVEPQQEMLRRKVKSVGLSLTDRVPGPYDLCIAQIWATNDAKGRLEVEREKEGKKEVSEGA
jgi:NADH dehydrogenase [ubiquinone] 1 alpha subcomplex assembly factor 1